jgi:hypothetical protein
MIVATLPQGELLSSLMKLLEKERSMFYPGLMPAGTNRDGVLMYNVLLSDIGDTMSISEAMGWISGFVSGWQARAER